MKVKVRKGKGNLLEVPIPKEVVEKLKLKEGDGVEFVYRKSDNVHYFIRTEKWPFYVSWSEISDRELYNRYVRGHVTFDGLWGYMLRQRVNDYIARTRRKRLEKALREGKV